MKSFRIVVDGVDKIGKTTLIKKIFKDLNIKDVSYSKSSLNSKDTINLYKKDYNVIESSISYRMMELRTSFTLGRVSKKEYFSSMKRYQKHLSLEQSYFHIYLYSSKAFVVKNRLKGLENYCPIQDSMIIKNLTHFYKENNIPYIIVNVEDKTDLIYFRKMVKIASSTKQKQR